MQPIPFAEWPTGALVSAGSLWLCKPSGTNPKNKLQYPTTIHLPISPKTAVLIPVSVPFIPQPFQKHPEHPIFVIQVLPVNRKFGQGLLWYLCHQ